MKYNSGKEVRPTIFSIDSLAAVDIIGILIIAKKRVLTEQKQDGHFVKQGKLFVIGLVGTAALLVEIGN